MTKRFKDENGDDWETDDTSHHCAGLVIRRVEELMPVIEIGDAFVMADVDRVVLLVKDTWKRERPNCFVDIFNEVYDRSQMKQQYRHGKLIWERKR